MLISFWTLEIILLVLPNDKAWTLTATSGRKASDRTAYLYDYDLMRMSRSFSVWQKEPRRNETLVSDEQPL